MRFSSRQDRSRENNNGVQRDATDGKFKTNRAIQEEFRNKVADDPDLSRGVTIKSAKGYRWDWGS